LSLQKIVSGNEVPGSWLQQRPLVVKNTGTEKYVILLPNKRYFL